MRRSQSTSLLMIGLLLPFLLGGCAARKAYETGRDRAMAEDWDQAVYNYSKALALEPQNIAYKKALDLARVKASQHHLELAKSYMEAGALELAIIEYQVAATLDPTNRYVADSLENALEQKQELEANRTEEQTELERLKEETREAGGIPILQPSSDAPITLNFPANTKVKDIYTALGKAAGINVLFDNAIRDQETFSIDIAEVTFQKALNLIAIANRHFYKPLDSKTLMIIPDNPQKRRDYEDHVVKTFYLSNAAPNDVVNTLRGLLDARRIATNASLNAITIRDTPDKIRVMERIIDANDKPPSEVVIDVEILEVRNSRDINYGAGLSSYSVTQTLNQPDTINSINGLRISSIPFINASDWLLTVPNILYRLEKTQGNIRTLARPSLRALDGKQVTLRLGDQVPIETSTFSVNTGGGGQPLTRNFQFRDIGTNIDITPRVHHNNEVTLLLQVEVTSVGEDPDGPAGPTPPTFGNRRINTEIRLKDGETNLLAGLFTSAEENSRAGVPFLSDVPVLRSIFSTNARTRRETDIVLTLTPHIVRTPNIRKKDMESFFVGTATNIGGATAVSEPGRGGSPFEGSGASGNSNNRRGRNRNRSARPTPVRPTPAPNPATPGGAPSPGTDPQPGRRGSFSPEPGQPSPANVLPPSARDLGGTIGSAAAAPATPTPTPAPTPALTPGVVSIVPAVSTVGVDEEVLVTVMITGATRVSHAPFWLTFDPTVVEAISVAEGDFMGADGTPTELLSNIRADGRIVVGLSRLGRSPGVTGSGVLATLRFRSKAAGTATLNFSNASLRDADSRVLPSAFQPGTITVQ